MRGQKSEMPTGCTCSQNGYTTRSAGTKSEMGRSPTCAQSGYINPAVPEVPNAWGGGGGMSGQNGYITRAVSGVPNT